MKVTKEDAIDIIRMYCSGMTAKEVAEEVGITKNSVYYILEGKCQRFKDDEEYQFMVSAANIARDKAHRRDRSIALVLEDENMSLRRIASVSGMSKSWAWKRRKSFYGDEGTSGVAKKKSDDMLEMYLAGCPIKTIANRFSSSAESVRSRICSAALRRLVALHNANIKRADAAAGVSSNG